MVGVRRTDTLHICDHHKQQFIFMTYLFSKALDRSTVVFLLRAIDYRGGKRQCISDHYGFLMQLILLLGIHLYKKQHIHHQQYRNNDSGHYINVIEVLSFSGVYYLGIVVLRIAILRYILAGITKEDAVTCNQLGYAASKRRGGVHVFCDYCSVFHLQPLFCNKLKDVRCIIDLADLISLTSQCRVYPICYLFMCLFAFLTASTYFTDGGYSANANMLDLTLSLNR